MDYWKECILEAFEIAGITATQRQIDNVALLVKEAHGVYGETHGHHFISDPRDIEIKRLSLELKKEKQKVYCEECNGKGYVLERCGPTRTATFDCSNCGGEGSYVA